MPSFNLVFHLSSALAFAFLIFWILRLEAQLKFHRRLWATLDAASPAPVLLDWPSRFLQRLSVAYGFELKGGLEGDQAQRIDLAPWVRCHAALSIKRIACGPGPKLSVHALRSDEGQGWQVQLEKSLGGRFKIELFT